MPRSRPQGPAQSAVRPFGPADGFAVAAKLAVLDEPAMIPEPAPARSPGPVLPPLNQVAYICDRASALVRDLLRQPIDRWDKHDQSPVTTIDLTVDAFLHKELRALMPEAGWLSEETADNPDRLTQRWLWVVDPIDGTRSLIAGKPEFVVSIALVETGVGPHLGVIGNPSTGELWSAQVGAGAFDRDGNRLQVRQTWNADDARLLVSRSDMRQSLWEGVAAEAHLKKVGSLAYKMALVASGLYDGHATPTPRSEWDAAAGAVLLAEAGGFCADSHGRPLLFNQPRPQYDGFVVASAAAFPALLEMARRTSAHWQAFLRSGAARR